MHAILSLQGFEDEEQVSNSEISLRQLGKKMKSWQKKYTWNEKQNWNLIDEARLWHSEYGKLIQGFVASLESGFAKIK